MKKMLFLVILAFLGSIAFAQKVYFIYIQSEGGAPFYVKMGDRVYSSTASGYLILPKLKDSTYSFYLGQPGNQAKELRFSVAVNNNDHGFLLKNFQNGWALFDMQSTSIINPAPSTSGAMYDTSVVKSDLFTRLLAKAVDDSTILMEPVMASRNEAKQSKKDEPKQITATTNDQTAVIENDVQASKDNATIKTVSTVTDTALVQSAETAVPKASADSVAITVSKDNNATGSNVADAAVTQTETKVAKDEILQTTQKIDSSLVNNSTNVQSDYKRSIVKRYAESSNFQGFGLTFLDSWNGTTDTIRLMIPNVIDANSLINKDVSGNNKQLTGSENDSVKVSFVSTTQTVTNIPSVSSTPVNDPSVNNKQASNAPAAKVSTDSVSSAPVVSNTTTVPSVTNETAAPAKCKDVASNKDFLELRKSMAARDRGEDMLEEARKAFSEKCYTTEQVRKLSVLFYTQEGKFLFFKEAKPFISDKDRFNTLVFELNEDTYMERFKSLLEN